MIRRGRGRPVATLPQLRIRPPDLTSLMIDSEGSTSQPLAAILIVPRMLLMTVLCSIPSLGAEPAMVEGSPKTLTRMAELSRYFGKTDIASIPVDVVARVNYWDNRDEAVFIEDEHDASYVDISSSAFEQHPRVMPGTRVRVIGDLILDGHYVSARSVELLDDFEEVKPRSVQIHELSLGDWWSHRVVARGQVQEVAHFGREWFVSLKSDDTLFAVHRFDDSEIEFTWPNMIGQNVEVQGTLTCELDHHRMPFRYQIRSNEKDPDLSLVGDADLASPIQSSAVKSSIQELLNSDGAAEDRFELHCQITSVVENQGYLVEDGGRGIFVHSELAPKFSLGHVVNLTVLRTGPNEFRSESLRSRSFQKIPPPPVFDVQSVDVGALPYRATLEADFVSVHADGDKHVINLRDGETEFTAIVDANPEVWDDATLYNARRVAVSGMIVPPPDDTTVSSQAATPSFAVELQGSSGIEVLSRWWQFSPTLAIAALALIAVVCTGGMICFAVLWLQVQRADRTNRRLSLQLVQSQKMDALGRLAGGVAHDFNNLLAGISSNLELIDRHDAGVGRQGGNDEEASFDQLRQQCLASAQRCTNQATKLVRSLLGFSRQEKLSLVIGDLNDVVEDAAMLARTSLGPDIEVSLDLDSDLPKCRFDHAQLEQVFLNLCFNARDAMSAGAGKIQLQTICQFDQEGDRVVEISVRDDGEGMSRETVGRIFEPFFTTKKVGEGTGLGLARSYGIIKQHGGTIQCDSQLGVGSVFTIILPAVSTTLENQSMRIDSIPDGLPSPVSSVWSHEQPQLDRDTVAEGPTAVRSPAVPDSQENSWSILLVDDDDEVRRVARLSLEALGHRVHDVSSGGQAIEFVEHGQPADVVIMDLVMPGLSGFESFLRLKSICPNLPVIICSGLVTEVERLSGQSDRSPEGCLAKPFQLADLQRTIAQVMSPSHSDVSKPVATVD